MPHFKIEAERAQAVILLDPAVHDDWFKAKPGPHEILHHPGGLNEIPVGSVSQNLDVKLTFYPACFLSVIPMPVGQEKEAKATPLALQDGLHDAPDPRGCIDQDGLSPRRVGQQVCVRLDGPGRQRMDFHPANREYFAASATVKIPLSLWSPNGYR